MKQNVAKLVQGTYDRVAENYDDLWSRHVELPQASLTQALSLQRGEHVADFACGTGIHTLEMLRLVTPGEVVGVDSSEEMLRAARERAAQEGLTLATVRAGAEEVIASAAAESFDVVSMRFCLAYLDWRTVLPRVGRILRPGGRLGILTSMATSVPQAWEVYVKMTEEFGLSRAEVYTPRSIGQLADVMQPAGLRITTSKVDRFRLWFNTGTDAAIWLEDSGFVTHPALYELPPETLRMLAGIFGQRLEVYREAQGVPLDMDIAEVVAQKERMP